MDAVDGEAGDVARNELFSVDLMRPHENRRRVHDAAIDDNCTQRAEDAQRHSAAAQQALAEQHTCQKADDSHCEHLPWNPRTGGEHDVGHQHGNRAHQEARLAAESDAGADHQRHDRLEARQHEERAAPDGADGAKNGDDDQLPRLGLAPLEDEEEGQHALQHDQQRDEIVFVPGKIEFPDEERHGDAEQNQYGG